MKLTSARKPQAARRVNSLAFGSGRLSTVIASNVILAVVSIGAVVGITQGWL